MDKSSRYSRRVGHGVPPIPPRPSASSTSVAQQLEIQASGSSMSIPNTIGIANDVSICEYGVISPYGGDVPHDPASKRRAANREYSERYRCKKHDHVLKLEDQQKSLKEIPLIFAHPCVDHQLNFLQQRVNSFIMQVDISDNSPKLEYYKEVEPYLVAENNSLEEKFSQVSFDLEAEEAEAEMLMSELEQLKLIDEALVSEMMKFKGK